MLSKKLRNQCFTLEGFTATVKTLQRAGFPENEAEQRMLDILKVEKKSVLPHAASAQVSLLYEENSDCRCGSSARYYINVENARRIMREEYQTSGHCRLEGQKNDDGEDCVSASEDGIYVTVGINTYAWHIERIIPQDATPIPVMLSSDGCHVGVILNPDVGPCRMEGCSGKRMRVRWDDGKITFPCTKDIKTLENALEQIG